MEAHLKRNYTLQILNQSYTVTTDFVEVSVISKTFFFTVLPAWRSNKGCRGDGRNGRVLLVIVLDAFEPLQVHNAKHCQRQADPKEYQTNIKPPAGKTRWGTFILTAVSSLLKRTTEYPPTKTTGTLAVTMDVANQQKLSKKAFTNILSYCCLFAVRWSTVLNTYFYYVYLNLI